MDTKQTNRPAEPGRKPRPQGARHPGQAESPRKKPAPQSTGAKRPGVPKPQPPKAQAPKAPQEKPRQTRAPQSQQRRRPAPQEPERRKAPQPEQKRAPARSKAPARPAPQRHLPRQRLSAALKKPRPAGIRLPGFVLPARFRKSAGFALPSGMPRRWYIPSLRPSM